jgi:LysM repeat protein
VRKWTKSACVVLAWCIIVPILAAAGSHGPGRPAQANISIASYTQATLASQPATAIIVRTAGPTAARPAATWTVRPGDTLSAIATALGVPGGWQALYTLNRQAIGPNPDLIRPGTTLTLPGTGEPARYTVAPGDTLSAIATTLAVPGGWQALYTLNRQAIGPNPDLIRPGTTLALPGTAAPGQSPRPPAPATARPPHPAPPPHQAAPTAPAGNPGQPSGLTAPGHATAPATGAKAPAGGMPRWLEDVLLAAGLLAASAFFVELAAALTHRRRAARHARPRAPAAARDRAQCAATKARIILADHERLIVTYSTQDDTVYVLTPPGEDPQAVLRAARLILPENTYEQLAGHLGVPSAWPLE